MRQHFWWNLGDGTMINIWHDNWHQLGSLAGIVPPPDRILAGVTNNSTLRQRVMSVGQVWPHGWEARFSALLTKGILALQHDVKDRIKWRTRDGSLGYFCPSQVWNDIRGTNPIVPWHKVVWFELNIPKHAFVLWLAILDRLKTQDWMIRWQCIGDLKCLFCKTMPYSVAHLFFECSYTLEMWLFIMSGGRGTVDYIIMTLLPVMQLQKRCMIDMMKARLCGVSLRWSVPIEKVHKSWGISKPEELASSPTCSPLMVFSSCRIVCRGCFFIRWLVGFMSGVIYFLMFLTYDAIWGIPQW